MQVFLRKFCSVITSFNHNVAIVVTLFTNFTLSAVVSRGMNTYAYDVYNKCVYFIDSGNILVKRDIIENTEATCNLPAEWSIHHIYVIDDKHVAILHEKTITTIRLSDIQQI